MVYEERIKKLEEMMKEVNARVNSILHISNTQNEQPQNKKTKTESPVEFLLKFKAKTDTEKTLVAIHYLEEKEELNITVKEINSILKEMREKVPKNISDKIQLLDKRGFLKLNGQEGKRKNWIVSNRGEEFLEGLKNG